MQLHIEFHRFYGWYNSAFGMRVYGAFFCTERVITLGWVTIVWER